MSRNIEPFTGIRAATIQPALWTFQHKVVVLPAGPPFPPPPVVLYPAPGPTMVEWFMIEADYRNKDVIAVGEKNAVQVQTTPINAVNCISTLGPSEALIWEPNDKGDPQAGMLTLPDFSIIQIALTPDVDLVDVTQFVAELMVGNLTCTLHCTIGNRSRR